VLFDGNPEPKQIVLSAEWIREARPKLMALIGSLAGVVSRQTSEPRAWSKEARQIEREQGARLIETLKEYNADASLAYDPLILLRHIFLREFRGKLRAHAGHRGSRAWPIA
jgi:hypothetical protein